MYWLMNAAITRPCVSVPPPGDEFATMRMVLPSKVTAGSGTAGAAVGAAVGAVVGAVAGAAVGAAVAPVDPVVGAAVATIASGVGVATIASGVGVAVAAAGAAVGSSPPQAASTSSIAAPAAKAAVHPFSRSRMFPPYPVHHGMPIQTKGA